MNVIKSLLLTFLFFLVFSSLEGQESLDTADQKPDYPVGELTRQAIQKNDFGTYFFPEYQNYTPDQEILNKLENHLYSYSIVIVLGTWCHDSQVQVPRFFKILDNLDYNTNDLKIIGVDRQKKAGDIDISLLNIQRVPTFIFYNNENETGRIIENPGKSLESDTYQILSK